MQTVSENVSRFTNIVLPIVLKNEGGFVHHPKDPGGATNHGITKRTLEAHRGRPVSVQEVRDLTKAEAAEIYRLQYWDAIRGDELPAGLDLVVFDGAVNSGPARSAKWLQKALRVQVDGVIGPKTLAAAKDADAAVVIEKAMDIRLGFLERLPHWSTFQKGWSRRIAHVEAQALRMAAEGTNVRAKPVLSAGAYHATVDAGNARAGAAVGVVAAVGAALTGLPLWAKVAAVAALLAFAVWRGVRSRDSATRGKARAEQARETRP